MYLNINNKLWQLINNNKLKNTLGIIISWSCSSPKIGFGRDIVLFKQSEIKDTKNHH